MTETELNCCVTVCDKNLDKNFWNDKYINQTTGWDLGACSPAFEHWANTYTNKNSSILIPGCGNAYEAKMLWNKGFKNITVIDIAPKVIAKLKNETKDTTIQVVEGDFFEHQGSYDVILEQTFFCALPPQLRLDYMYKMHQLLSPNGILAGLLFNREFEGGPPFGGNTAEYKELFNHAFNLKEMHNCAYSVAPRANSEVWFYAIKEPKIKLQLFKIEGITCIGCQKDAIDALHQQEGCIQAHISSDFKTILIKSSKDIEAKIIKNQLAFNSKITVL